MTRNKIFIFWLSLSILFRFIASITHNSWQHPDDWFQTLEYAHFFSQGVMSYTQEVALHMRNLTWPFLLSLPLRFAYFIDSTNVFLRVFISQFFISLLTLSVLLFWRSKLDQVFENKFFSLKESLPLHFSYFLVVFPWFIYSDFIQPSQENISIAFLFFALFFIQKKYFFYAGFFALACGLVRYPNGFLSLGLLSAVWIGAFKYKNYQNFYKSMSGALLAFILFGLADTYVYGRPYESFWMYYHYNVALSIGESVFGVQSAYEYWVYLKGHFARFFSIGFYPFLILAVLGVFRGAFLLQPWAWAILFYLIPHLIIGHKEGRFMRPIELLLLYAMLEYLFYKKESLKKFFNLKYFDEYPKLSRLFFVLLGLSIFMQNFIHFGASLRGTLFKSPSTYMSVGGLIQDQPNKVCAVITVRKPSSLFVPAFNKNKIPKPSFLYFNSSGTEQSLQEQLLIHTLFVSQGELNCSQEDKLLFHYHKTDHYFHSKGCDLLTTGLLALLPSFLGEELLKKDKIRGPWYRCPAEFLDEFRNKEFKNIFISQIDPLAHDQLINLTVEKMLKIKDDFEKKHGISVAH